MTKELFIRYTEGICTPEEKKQVIHWLETCTDDELDTILYNLWNTAWTPMPGDRARMLLQKMMNEIGPFTSITPVIRLKRNWWKPAMTAACLAGIIALAWMSLAPKKHTLVAKKEHPVTKPYKNQWLITINKEPVEKVINLEDGTIVQLAANSRLTYLDHFENDRRTVYLEGKAQFKVAKDKQRPFSVYSGNISTTALGTIFTVNALADKAIRVKLTEGKIVIRYVKQPAGKKQPDIYLAPGQELRYDVKKMLATVNYPAKSTNDKFVKNNKNAARQPAAISFSNAPLNEVFDKLQTMYHQTIRYNKEELADLYFTGAVSANDSLDAILKIISTMNGLMTEQQSNGFSITRSP